MSRRLIDHATRLLAVAAILAPVCIPACTVALRAAA